MSLSFQGLFAQKQQLKNSISATGRQLRSAKSNGRKYNLRHQIAQLNRDMQSVQRAIDGQVDDAFTVVDELFKKVTVKEPSKNKSSAVRLVRPRANSAPALLISKREPQSSGQSSDPLAVVKKAATSEQIVEGTSDRGWSWQKIALVVGGVAVVSLGLYWLYKSNSNTGVGGSGSGGSGGGGIADSAGAAGAGAAGAVTAAGAVAKAAKKKERVMKFIGGRMICVKNC